MLARLRWLLVALALAGQLGLGMVVPRALAIPGPAPHGPAAIGVICHAGADRPAPAPGHDRHDHDCAVCPLCVAAALPAPLLGSAPVPPAPPVTRVATVRPLPPARAPPVRRVAAAPPRGPPALT